MSGVSVLPTLWASATTLATPAVRLLLRNRARCGKEIPERLAEREGVERQPRPPGRLLWLHAASIGEGVSVLPVMSEVARLAPDVTMLVTTGTVTSAALLARRLPELDLASRTLHRFSPVDVPNWVNRFLDHWRPDAAAFIESELWPNLLLGCKKRRIPVALLNARMSVRSYRRWRHAPRFAGDVLASFAFVQAQNEAEADRLLALGAPRVSVPGNLKFAASPLPAEPEELVRAQVAVAGCACWLVASTHAGEEEIIVRAHQLLIEAHPGLVTIIVPRHPERGNQIAASIEGIPVAQRSRQEVVRPGGIWIADTLGELGLWYRLTGLALIGRSLIPPGGGQNPLEAARLNCAVAVGPYTGNFVDAVQVLDGAGALARVSDAHSIAVWVSALLETPDQRARMGATAAQAAARYAELPTKVASDLLALIPR
jgi:3-deoxy-D-manno-octulosonic-acid transferase